MTPLGRGRTRYDPKFYVFCCPQVPQGRGRPRDDPKSLSSVVRKFFKVREDLVTIQNITCSAFLQAPQGRGRLRDDPKS